MICDYSGLVLFTTLLFLNLLVIKLYQNNLELAMPLDPQDIEMDMMTSVFLVSLLTTKVHFAV